MKTFAANKKEYYLSLVFILLTVLFWGISFVSTKVVLAEIPPASIALFRQFIAVALLIPILVYSKTYSKIQLKPLLLLAASGLFGIVLYFVFENTGLKYTSASNASMIVAAVPVFTLFTEALFYKLKISVKMMLCVLLSIAGVYMVITVEGRLDLSSSMFFGNLLMVGAMVCWVVYTMINKSLSVQYSGIMMVTLQTLSSIFLFIPFVLPEIGSWKGISTVALLNLLYLGLFCSALAYFMYVYAAKRLGPTVSAAFLNLIPVVSVITGYIVLDEKLTFFQVVGMLLIMLTLFELSRKPPATASSL